MAIKFKDVEMVFDKKTGTYKEKNRFNRLLSWARNFWFRYKVILTVLGVVAAMFATFALIAGLPALLGLIQLLIIITFYCAIFITIWMGMARLFQVVV